MQPTIGVDSLGGTLWVVPVTLHNPVAAGTDFAGFIDICNAAVFATYFYFPVAVGPANGTDARLEGIIHLGHRIHRTALGLAVRNHDPCKIHIADQPFHQFAGASRAGNDPSA